MSKFPRRRDRHAFPCALGVIVCLAWFTLACWTGAHFTPDTDQLTRIATTIIGSAGFVGCIAFFTAGFAL